MPIVRPLFLFLFFLLFSSAGLIDQSDIPDAGNNAETCDLSFVLQGNTPLTLSGVWTIQSGNAIIEEPTNPQSILTLFEPGVVVLRWSFFDGLDEIAFDEVSITVSAPPDIADAGENQTICANSTTLSANQPVNGTGEWTLVSGSGTIVDANSSTTQITNLGVGVSIFRWTISNGSCTPTFDEVSITVSAPPDLADAGENQTICANTTTLSANQPVNGTGEWTLVSGSGTIVDANSSTTQITNLGVGVSIFRWTISNGSCTPTFDEVSITVSAPPNLADAGENQTICANSTTLSANQPVNGTGEWTLVSGSGTIVDPNSSTTQVTNLGVGVSIFRWTISNGSCTPTFDEVSITISAPPDLADAGENQTICANTTTLSANQPVNGTGEWTLVSGSGTIVDANSSTTQVTNLGVGVSIFRWTISSGSCTPTFDEVSITVTAQPDIADAGENQTICANSTTLSANQPVNGTGEWTLVSGSGTIVDANSSTTQVTNLGVGVSIFRWTISNGSCTPTFDEVSITVTQQGSPPDAGSNQNICSSSAVLNASGTGIWTVVSGSGIFANAQNPQTPVNGVGVGVNVYRWTVSGGACPDQFADVTIFRSLPPDFSIPGPDQTICSETAQLAANTPVIGAGTWSIQSGSGVFSDVNSPTATVTNLSAGTTILIWTVTNGACPERSASVSITRQLSPSPAVVANNQTLCTGTSILSATNPLIGTGTWAVVSGTASIQEPGSSTTTVSNLSVGENIFQWTVSNGVCPSNSAILTIQRDAEPSVSNAGNNQSTCSSSIQLNAQTPTTGTGVWLVVSGSATLSNVNITNPVASNLSFGNNIFRWTVSNGTCASSSSDVTIFRETPPSIPDAGADQNVCASSTIFNGSYTGEGTLVWSVISGNGVFSNPNSAVTSVSSLSIGINIFRLTASKSSCPSAFDEVVVVRELPASPAIAGNDQTICASTATLSAQAPQNGSGVWSLVSGSGTIANPANANTTISGLLPGVSVFRWTVSNGSCTPTNDEVSITVVSPVSTANAGQDQQVCALSATLQASTPSSGTGTWSVISGSGSFVNINSPVTQVNGLSPGENIFLWTVSNGVCQPSFDEVSVFRFLPPTQAVTGADFSSCSSTAQLTANTPTSGSGQWSIVSGSGVFNNSSNPTTFVSGLAPGINVLQWSISNGACTPSTAQITIQVNLNPVEADAGPNQSICNATATLQANVPSSGTGNWNLVSGTGFIANPQNPQTGVSGLGIGANVFQWTVSFADCVASDQVTITRSIPPSEAQPGNNQTVCASSATLQATPPVNGTGTWTLVSGNGTIVNPTNSVTTVNNLGIGSNVFRWTVSSGACPSVFADVTIVRQQAPVQPDAGNDLQICASEVQLSASTPLVGTGVWTVISGSGTFQNPNSPLTQVNGLAIGENIFQYTVSNGICPSVSDQISITRFAPPSQANAGNNQTVCSTTTVLNAAAPQTGSGLWTIVSGSANLLNPASPNAVLTGLNPGSVVLQWTVSNGNCPPTSSQVTITVLSSAGEVDAGSDQLICSDVANVSAQIPSGFSGSWTLISGNGTIQSPNTTTSTISAIGIGANVFRFTASNGICSAIFDEIVITRVQNPTVSNAGTNQQICATSTTLNGNQPLVGTGSWQVISGSATFANANQFNTSVSGLAIGTNVLQWTISNSPCLSSSSQVSILVNTQPSTAQAGTNQTVCENFAQLQGNSPAIGTGQWTLISGTGTIQNAASPITSVSNLSIGANVFQWTVTNGVCPPSSSQVTITRQAPPVSANAGSDQTICALQTTLNGNNPGQGSGLWTVVSGTGTFVDPTSFQTTVSGLSAGLNSFRWTISSPGCAPSSDEVQINVTAPPTTANAGTGFSVCSAVANLNANVPQIGSGIWTVVSGSGTFANPSAAQTQVSNLSVGTNIFQWTISNGNCPPSSSQISIVRDANPTVANAGTNQTLCSTSAVLGANAPSVGTGQWSVISGNATFSNASSPTSSVSNLASGVNVLQWTISNGVCPPSTSQLTLTVDNNPLQANAGADIQVCGTTATLNATAPVSGTGTWTLVSGSGSIVSVNNPGSLVNGLSSGASTFRWTVVNGSCTSFDDVVITAFAQPSIANAGQNQTVCDAQITLSANVPTSGTGVWSIISGSGTFANPSSATTSVTNLGTGTNVFQWTISNGVCPPSSSQVNITRLPGTTPSNAGVDQQVCSASVTLSGSNPGNGTGVWSVVSGSATILNPNSPTSQVSNLAPGNTVLRWTIIQSGCPPSFDEVQITRFLPPTAAFAGNDTSICGTEFQLQASVPLVGQGFWDIVAGSALFSEPDNPNQTLSGLSIGTVVLKWTISNGICPVSEDLVQLTVFVQPPVPALPDTLSICDSEVVLTPFNTWSGNAQWTLISGNADIASPTQSSTLLTNLNEGVNILKLEWSNTTCSSSETISIINFIRPELVFAGNDTTMCLPQLQLNAELPEAGIGIWTANAPLTFSNPNAFNTIVSNVPEGMYSLVWTVTNGVCEPISDTLIVEKRPDIQVPFAGADTSICSNQLVLYADASSASQTNWEIIQGSGDFSDSTSNTAVFDNISTGLTILLWQVSDGVCPAISDTITIQRFAPPTSADAGEDQTVCDNQFTLNANFPLTGSGVWNILSGSGVLFNPMLPFSPITGLEIGTTVLTWTITNGVCASIDTLVLTIQPKPIANAGFDLTICNTGTLLLQAVNPPNGSGLWDVFDASGDIVNPNTNITQVFDVLPGINTYQWTVTVGECSATDLVTFYVLAQSDPECEGQGPSVFIPEGFSPNFDNINDRFVIKKPANKLATLRIYNRWGDLVFESLNYQNEFDGFANTGYRTDDKRLPEGTYYYRLDIEGFENPFTGYLTLWR